MPSSSQTTNSSIVSGSPAVGQKRPLLRRARPLLGTVVEITVSADAATVDTQAAVNAAFAQIEWIQRLMSYHEPESDVSRLNRHAVRKVTQVDDQTYLVLSWALELFRQSSGAFDIAIASLLTRWGYLPADQGPTCPSSCRETSAAIELLPENSVRFLRPLAIDLGGIAKGYAVDRAVETLQAQGVTQGLVNAGGDLRAFGPKPEPVAVRNPMQPKSFIPLPDLSEAALATSAHYFSAKPWQGRVVTPLVNPLTDEPCALQRSVSVRAPSCLLADALCKVVHVGPSSAEALLDRYCADAWILEPAPARHHDF